MINKAKQFVLKIPLTPPFPKGDCMVFSYSFVSQWLMSIPASEARRESFLEAIGKILYES
jgi:hypothetical protein